MNTELPQNTPQPTQASPQAQPTAPAAKPAPSPTAVPEVTHPVPNPLAHVPIGSEPVPYTARGYHVVASVRPDQVVFTAEQLDKEGFAIDTITGVDWPAEAQMEAIYDYFHPISGLRAVVRARVPRDNPEISTISGVFPGANWHEREAHDFFGLRFVGHPNLTPFLLPEDATYHPLRKDFTS